MQFKSGLANFSPQEGHIISKDSPVCRTCVYSTYIERGGLKKELEWRYLLTVSYAKTAVE